MKHKNNNTALTLATLAICLVPNLDAFAGFDIPFGVGIGSDGSWSLGIGSGAGGGAAGGIAAALCGIVGWFQGGVGQAIASLAVIFLGISAFFGKVTWGTALMFAVGIFAIFGSADIVQAIVKGTGGGSGWHGGISGSSDGGFGGLSIGYGSSTSCGGF